MRLRYKFLIMLVVTMFVINFIYDYNTEMAFSHQDVVIVIDPGHGGRDPGMVGVNGAYEKDINLEISMMLKEYLNDAGYQVVLTREEDIGLYSENTSNKKAEDLLNRVRIIDQVDADMAISIHQNSFSDPSCSGAQVFYYTGSEEGEKIAENILDAIKENVDDSNNRKVKNNESYYLLKNTPSPTVIVECGFLSNSEECEMLCEADYQNKVAYAIFLGIENYYGVK